MVAVKENVAKEKESVADKSELWPGEEPSLQRYVEPESKHNFCCKKLLLLMGNQILKNIS